MSRIPLPHPDEVRGDTDLNVFVPGLMGAGILLSAVILISDGIKRLLPSRGERRRTEIAKGVHGLVSGAARAAGWTVGPRSGPRRGLRSRNAYAAGALTLIGASWAVYRAGESTYSGGGTLEGNLWPLGFGIGFGIAFGIAGSTLVILAVAHRHLPRRAAALVAKSPLGRLHAPPDDYAQRARLLAPAKGES